MSISLLRPYSLDLLLSKLYLDYIVAWWTTLQSSYGRTELLLAWSFSGIVPDVTEYKVKFPSKGAESNPIDACNPPSTPIVQQG